MDKKRYIEKNCFLMKNNNPILIKLCLKTGSTIYRYFISKNCLLAFWQLRFIFCLNTSSSRKSKILSWCECTLDNHFLRIKCLKSNVNIPDLYITTAHATLYNMTLYHIIHNIHTVPYFIYCYLYITYSNTPLKSTKIALFCL